MRADSSLYRRLIQALISLFKRGAFRTVNLMRGLWAALRTLLTISQCRLNRVTDIVMQRWFTLRSSSPPAPLFNNIGSMVSEGSAVASSQGAKISTNVLNPGFVDEQQISAVTGQSTATSSGTGYESQAFLVVQGHGETTTYKASHSGRAPSNSAPADPSNSICPDESPSTAGSKEIKFELKTTMPSALKRYDRKFEVPAKKPEWHVEGLSTSDSYKRRLPQSGDINWKSCGHPEGILYHRGEMEGIVFFTDVDVCDPTACNETEKVIEHLLEQIKSLAKDQTVSEVVLERQEDENVGKDKHTVIWEYYIVDHSSHHLLWLTEHTITTNNYKGAESAAHIGQLLRYEYYMHLSYFPHEQILKDDFFTELKGILVWSLVDSLTSIDSLAPYDVATMESFLKLIGHMQDINGEFSEYSVAAGARLRLVFEKSRFDNFSGFPCARLSRNQSVRGEGRKEPSLLFRFISFLFFDVPTKYLKSLDGLYMDNVVFQAPFKIFVDRASNVWQQDVINAAVLFTANIAYLAIPTLIPESGRFNAAATASFVSITLSLSSVIFGQLLGKKIQALQEEPTDTIAEYFREWWSTKSGLSELAVMYSLPYVLMIWGAIAFILAIFLLAFRDIKWNAQTITIMTFLVGAVIICLWIVLEITGWDKISSHLAAQWKQLLYTTKLRESRPDPPAEANVIKRTIPEKLKDTAQAINDTVKNATKKYVLKKIMMAVRVIQRFRLGRGQLEGPHAGAPSSPNADLEHGTQSQESARPAAQTLLPIEGGHGDSLHQTTGNGVDGWSGDEISMNKMAPVSGEVVNH